MVGNSNWFQPSVWLRVFDMLWFHCCLFSTNSRGMWDRSHRKCHYSKLSTFAFYCQLAYSVIHNLEILQVSLLLLNPTLQYLHCDRTRGRVWFAPELKLPQTSLQTRLNTGTDCTASAYIAGILCSWIHGLILTCDPGSGCLIWSPFSAPTARLQSPSSTDSCSEFFFLFPPFLIPSWFEDAPWKNTKPSHTLKSGVPRATLKLDLKGQCCTDHLPSASGELRVRKPGFECHKCYSSVCIWKHTHNENAFHQSSLQQLLKTA